MQHNRCKVACQNSESVKRTVGIIVLYSQFFVDEDRYVISASEIVEIIPCVALKKLPMLPDYAAGLLNYHGEQMPIVDLCSLLLSRPCKRELGTRIIVVNKSHHNLGLMKIGFMVEKATDVIAIDADSFLPPAMRNPDAPIDGNVAEYKGILITEILIDDMVDKMDDRFFNSPGLISAGN